MTIPNGLPERWRYRWKKIHLAGKTQQAARMTEVDILTDLAAACAALHAADERDDGDGTCWCPCCGDIVRVYKPLQGKQATRLPSCEPDCPGYVARAALDALEGR